MVVAALIVPFERVEGRGMVGWIRVPVLRGGVNYIRRRWCNRPWRHPNLRQCLEDTSISMEGV